MQDHRYSFEIDATPEELWQLFWGKKTGDVIEHGDVRIEILHGGDETGEGLVRHCHFRVPRYLLSGGDSVANPDSVLGERVVYVIPRLNPDGAETMFARVRYDRRRNGLAFDDDSDGRVDEDPGEDLNGDGLISVMRVADPSGDYMVHPDDPRLMRRADASKGESGTYAIYIEGRDSDGDGFLNEDGPGGVDLDRNFQHAYPYWERDAGPYMVSEPETRALMDFVVAHRNIGAILTFGHSDNLVTPPDNRGNLADARMLDLPEFAMASYSELWEQGIFTFDQPTGGFGGFFGGGGGGGSLPQLRGAQPGRDNDPGAGQRPETTVNAADRTYFESVSETYREITGITQLATNREAEGAFFQFGYYQYGVPSFSTQGWGLPGTKDEGEEDEAAGEPAGGERARAAEGEVGGSGRRTGGVRGRAGGARRRTGGGGDAGDGIDAEVLAALEDAGVDAFVDWTAYSHPTLGQVEIGGFVPYATTNPPEANLGDLGERHGEFLVRLAGMLPRVTIVDTEVTAHGGGLFTVEVEVANSGFLPTSLRHGVISRSVQPTTVQIQIDPDSIVSGAPKSYTIQRLEGSGSREKVTWVIRGQPGGQVEVRVRSQKGGTDSSTVTLR